MQQSITTLGRASKQIGKQLLHDSLFQVYYVCGLPTLRLSSKIWKSPPSGWQVPLQPAATLSHWLGSWFESLISLCPCSCASFQMLVGASSKSTAIFALLCPGLDIWSTVQKHVVQIDATSLAWGQILNETSGALRQQKCAMHFIWKKMKGVKLWWRLRIARTDNDPNDDDSMAIPLGMDELK